MPQPLHEIRRRTWHAEVGFFQTPTRTGLGPLHESDLHSSLEFIEMLPDWLFATAAKPEVQVGRVLPRAVAAAPANLSLRRISFCVLGSAHRNPPYWVYLGQA